MVLNNSFSTYFVLKFSIVGLSVYVVSKISWSFDGIVGQFRWIVGGNFFIDKCHPFSNFTISLLFTGGCWSHNISKVNCFGVILTCLKQSALKNVRVMVFNAILNNISVILYISVLMVEETSTW